MQFAGRQLPALRSIPMCHIRSKITLPHTFPSSSTTSGKPQPAPQPSLRHILVFPILHIRREIALPHTFPSSSVTSGQSHSAKAKRGASRPSSSAPRFALAAGGRSFRRRCANRSALRTDWGKIATGAQKGRFCAPTEKNCIRCAEWAFLRTDCCYNKLGLRLWSGNGAVNCDYRDSESRRG